MHSGHKINQNRHPCLSATLKACNYELPIYSKHRFPGTRLIIFFMKIRRLFFLLACLAAAFPADHARAQKAAVKLDTKQLLMLKAAQHVQQGDMARALADYDQVLAQDGGFIPAYIQRSVIKREIKDTAGSRADAMMAVRLSEAGLMKDSHNARLYYQRGMGYRLLRDFPKAKENIAYALRLPGADANWQADLRNMEIEEKFTQ